MQHDMIEHTCVADHCIYCCPVARSYGEGYETAKSFYQLDTYAASRIMRGALLVAVFIILVLAFHTLTRKDVTP